MDACKADLTSEPSPSAQSEALLDTYFTRFHAKPYHVLDESSVRQRLQLDQLPSYLVHAIYAVAARYATINNMTAREAETPDGILKFRFTPHPRGYQCAVKLSEEFAAKSRHELDVDEPSIDALQALILLVLAFTTAGKGKKAYMLMCKELRFDMLRTEDRS